MQCWKLLKRILVEQDGPTSVEYAIMLAMIVIACIGTVFVLAQTTQDSFQNSTEAIQNAFN